MAAAITNTDDVVTFDVDKAKEQHRAEQAWMLDGGTEPRPSTPDLDALRATFTIPAKARSNGGGRLGQIVHFTRDGKRVPDSQNRLSRVAFYFTKGLGRDGSRLTVGELRDEVRRQTKITDPEREAWDITIGDKRFGAELVGSAVDKVHDDTPAKPKRTTVTKPKAPAKPKAKTPAAKRDVTPRPKASQGAKRPASKANTKA